MNITSFNENTSKEVEDNLKRLGEHNIKGLVLDLRENPGRLLNEGVAVAGHWLRRGEVVVSHRGRATPRSRTWRAAVNMARTIRSWCW